MIRDEWEQISNPHMMLGCLRGRASDRKLRLFGVACWLTLKEGVTDDLRRGLKEVERYTDGEIDPEALWQVYMKMPGVVGRRLAVPRRMDIDEARRISRWAICPTEEQPAASTSWGYVSPLGREYEKESTGHGRLLHDIFGEPWRRVRFDATWRTPDVCALAESTYGERDPKTWLLDPVRLGVLGDALEEAGCNDARLLAHCRGGGPHVRGCWVVDLCLDRR
jgi:hypothetical protein